MGAFYLKVSGEPHSLKQISHFVGLNSFVERQLGNSKLLLYQKQKGGKKNYVEDGTWFLGAIGSPIYRGMSYCNGLERLLSDYKDGTFSFTNIIGHYIILIWNGKSLAIISDGGSLVKAYLNKGGTTLSSSFLALVQEQNSLSINRNAVIENLITGGIGGSDTLFNEILVLSNSTVVSLPNISFFIPVPSELPVYANRGEALDDQAGQLDNYFQQLAPLANEIGADSGLTGGLDSRLLLALSLKHFKRLQLHSHYRDVKSLELKIAGEIADSVGIPLLSPKVKSWQLLTPQEQEKRMEEVFLFYDGQIRLYSFWTEAYNTQDYRLRVLNGNGVGLHGIGGEQYRNGDRYIVGRSLRSWLKYYYVGNLAGSPFTNGESENDFYRWIESKVMKMVNLMESRCMSLLDLKRIQNEYVTQAYRGARTQAETKLSFFFSPFADHTLSQRAYAAVPFLGSGLDFEQELIVRLSPALAALQSDYGFPFNRKEPIGLRWPPLLLKNLLSPRFAQWLLESYRNRRRSKGGGYSFGKSELEYNLVEHVKDLKLPISIDQILARPGTAPLVISMGYLLLKFQHKILRNAPEN